MIRSRLHSGSVTTIAKVVCISSGVVCNLSSSDVVGDGELILDRKKRNTDPREIFSGK